jgi:hypothetical protein
VNAASRNCRRCLFEREDDWGYLGPVRGDDGGRADRVEGREEKAEARSGERRAVIRKGLWNAGTGLPAYETVVRKSAAGRRTPEFGVRSAPPA